MDAKLGTIRLLVVEDNADDLELLLRALQDHGLEVDCQRVLEARGLEAALADPRGWDLVLSDHSLPGFGSEHAFELVSRIAPQLPFIIVTGTLDDAQALRALHQGVVDVVSKDRLPRLVPLVRRVVSEARSQREMRRAREELQQLAYYDGVTGLPNRTQFLNTLGGHLSRHSGSSIGLVVVELADYVKLERNLGDDAAERLVGELSGRLKQRLGGAGGLARMARDRFAFRCPAMGSAEAFATALQVLTRQLPRVVEVSGLPLGIRWHVGASRYPATAAGAEELWAQALCALRRAARRQDGPEIYDAAWRDGQEGLLQMEGTLQKALQREQFFLEYQPQFRLGEAAPCGAEALLRWRHPQLGIVSPLEFIPLLEETGLIVPVGEWVLRQACREAARWRRQARAEMTVAVNLSLRQFERADLPELVRRALRESGLPAAALELEITESMAASPQAEVTGTLEALRRMGVSVAIDDFGTGYSSLSYLKDYAVDKLKIDRSFVKDLEQDPRNQAIVQAIIQMAVGLGMRVIAEGVETAPQAELLRRLNCEFGQGYHLGRPMAGNEVLERWQAAQPAPEVAVRAAPTGGGAAGIQAMPMRGNGTP